MKLPFTEPIEEIVPNQVDQYLSSLLSDYSSLLTEIVNFGSHILQWDISTPREGRDNHLPTLFLRNGIELLDGMSTLIKNCSIDPSKHLARSLFENNLNLMYLLEKDEKLRIHSFMVWQIKNHINTLKKFLSDSDSSKNFMAKLKKDPVKIDMVNYLDKEETKKSLQSKLEVLKEDRFREISSEYERIKKKYRRKPNWYSLYDGPRDIESLASHFKKIYLYEFEYRNYSNHIHSMHISKGYALVEGEEDKAQIIQIRDFQSCKNVTLSAITYSVECLFDFVKKRLPDKERKFRAWYLLFSEQKNEIMDKPFEYRK